MTFRNRDIIWMVIDDKASELGGISLRRSDECNIKDPIDQRLHLRECFHTIDLQQNVGIFFLERRDQLGQQTDATRGQYVPDGNRADVTARRALSHKLGVFSLS